MKLFEFFQNNENQSDYEISNLEKLDHLLIKLSEMIINGQKKDPDHYGMVAACVVDPDNNVVARLNIPDKSGKRIHAERAAMNAYQKKYGEIPEGCIIVTTLSPCCDPMDDRHGGSCTELINNSPIKKVYCGYQDPSQHNHDERTFTLQETNNPEIRKICEKFAETFLDEIDENFKDGRNPQDKGDSRRHGIPKKASLASLDKIAKQGGRKGQLAHWQANMRRGRKKAAKEVFDIGMGQASHGREDTIAESTGMDEFKEILKKFLPIAKKFAKLEKLPTIVLKRHIKHGDQPTQGRYFNDRDVLEIAVAGRHPVDVLRTLAHELTHARQDQQHVDIDPTTGSPEENEANVVAGIIMRHFNKQYPEYLELQPLSEGVNNGRKRICR